MDGEEGVWVAVGQRWSTATHTTSCPAWVSWPSSCATHGPGKAHLVQRSADICDPVIEEVVLQEATIMEGEEDARVVVDQHHHQGAGQQQPLHHLAHGYTG